MKKQIMILVLTTGIVVNSFGQAVEGTIPTGLTVPTTPTGISLLQAETKLITQNSFSVSSGTKLTGSFAADARWNSMGNLVAPSQTLNGFRTQNRWQGIGLGA